MTKHHFFGKNCSIDSSLRNTKDFCEKIKDLGFDFKHEPLFLDQIHSSKVVVVESLECIKRTSLEKADAIVTNVKNLPICIVTADCVPLVFYDEESGIIAIAHSGWRGAKGGVIENTVKEMIKLGSEARNIKVRIGPCIRQKSYEVSQEFFEDFIKESKKNKIFFSEANKRYHFMFDLAGYCFFKLSNLGIELIEDDGVDTYESEDKLFSYRRSTHREEANYGRNISVVMLK